MLQVTELLLQFLWTGLDRPVPSRPVPENSNDHRKGLIFWLFMLLYVVVSGVPCFWVSC